MNVKQILNDGYIYWSIWIHYNTLELAEENAEKKGMEKGREEGKKEALLQTAAQMRAQGIPMAIISQCTGLSEKDIE